MEAMRETWTDDRLDYLNHRVDDGFKRVDERFDEADRRMARLESQFERLNDNFAELNRMIIKSAYGIIGTMFVGFMTVLATTL
jgi:hypothetical protein